MTKKKATRKSTKNKENQTMIIVASIKSAPFIIVAITQFIQTLTHV